MYVLCEDCQNHYEDTFQYPCSKRPRGGMTHHEASISPIAVHVANTKDARARHGSRKWTQEARNDTPERPTALPGGPVTIIV